MPRLLILERLLAHLDRVWDGVGMGNGMGMVMANGMKSNPLIKFNSYYQIYEPGTNQLKIHKSTYRKSRETEKPAFFIWFTFCLVIVMVNLWERYV